MAPRYQELHIYQGDDYRAVVNVTKDGSPVDISTYTAKAEIRRDPADVDATADATLTCVVTGNTIALSLAHAITATLTDSYVWDLQVTDPGGLITTILFGPVKVTAEVTRP